MTRGSLHYDWRWAGGLLLLTAIAAGLLFDGSIAYLMDKWSDFELGEYGHGYVTVMIAAYLVYLRLPELKREAPGVDPRGLVLIAIAGMTWLVASLAYIEMLRALAMLILLIALVWSITGWSVTRICLPALLFLLYAIPVWFPLSPLLQEWTADFVFSAVRIFDIPAFREDNFIVLPAGTLSIEEACSGLRFLLTALILGTLYGQLYFTSFMQKLAVVVIAAVAAIAANFIRVLIIVYIAYVSDMQHPMVDDHLSLGWYVFAAILFLLLALDTWLHRRRSAADAEVEPAAETAGGMEYSTLGAKHVAMVVAVALVMLAAPVWHGLIMKDMDAAVEPAVARMPDQVGDWTKTATDIAPGWEPVFTGASVSRANYRSGDNVIIVAQASYTKQSQGEELINYLNNVFDRKQWRSNYSFPRPVTTAGGDVLEQSIVNKRDTSAYLIWYWYEVAGVRTSSRYSAKLYQVIGMLTGRHDASATIIVTPARESASNAIETFHDAWRQRDAGPGGAVDTGDIPDTRG